MSRIATELRAVRKFISIGAGVGSTIVCRSSPRLNRETARGRVRPIAPCGAIQSDLRAISLNCCGSKLAGVYTNGSPRIRAALSWYTFFRISSGRPTP